MIMTYRDVVLINEELCDTSLRYRVAPVIACNRQANAGHIYITANKGKGTYAAAGKSKKSEQLTESRG